MHAVNVANNYQQLCGTDLKSVVFGVDVVLELCVGVACELNCWNH